MFAGKPHRIASAAAVLLLAVANAVAFSGHLLCQTQPGRQALHVALQSQRPLFSRASLGTETPSSPEQSRLTVPGIRAYQPVADFSGCLRLSRPTTRPVATGVETASG